MPTPSVSERLEMNRQTWDQVFGQFAEASALPAWGPFDVGTDLDLLGPIEGKTFLEIACGSGRSIRYLIEKGARHVTGVDLSEAQIQEAGTYNAEAIERGSVLLIQSPMEAPFAIEPVDVAFSVYGFGWAQDPEAALANVFAALKPGGRFVWSWDHAFFHDVVYHQKKYALKRSYHDESPVQIPRWRGAEAGEVSITYRKTATWFRLLRSVGFEVEGFYEPEPKNTNHGHEDLYKYYSIQKARMVPSSCIFACRKPR